MTRLMSLVTVALLSIPTLARAQAPGDALGVCLTDNTTGKDRKDLAKWLFLAMAAHPDIKQYAGPTASTATEEIARTMGALVTRLLTESCANETKAVVKAGGTGAFQLAFQRLGQVATLELMADKAVNESIGMFERFLDKEKLAKLVGAQ